MRIDKPGIYLTEGNETIDIYEIQIRRTTVQALGCYVDEEDLENDHEGNLFTIVYEEDGTIRKEAQEYLTQVFLRQKKDLKIINYLGVWG